MVGISIGGRPGICSAGGPGAGAGSPFGPGRATLHSTLSRGAYVEENVSLLIRSPPRETVRTTRTEKPSAPGYGVQPSVVTTRVWGRRMSVRGEVEIRTSEPEWAGR